MISLAFDTASDRCTVAATDGHRTAHRQIDGARQHARAILSLIGEVLTEIGAEPVAVSRVVSADGPGSFTGLRVSTAVAKALVWRRAVEWWVTPSLLGRAWRAAPVGGGAVLALSDALRGDLYAGAWRIGPTSVAPIGLPPRAIAVATLGQFGVLDAVIGSVPPALLGAVESTTGTPVIHGPDALPDARALLALVDVAGGATRVLAPAEWQPEYGRPAEAQAVWERKHGMALPSAPGIAR